MLASLLVLASVGYVTLEIKLKKHSQLELVSTPTKVWSMEMIVRVDSNSSIVASVTSYNSIKPARVWW